MADQDVIEYTLDNGLKVLIRPIHTAPIASDWLWYRVGGRNEQPGKTGISHWVEHMMFKGTPAFPKGRIMREINSNGGELNGFTSQDYTAYFEILPADRLDLGLRIEADRMANSVFDTQEAENERTVIISEREGSENSPNFLLREEVVAAAYRNHPYGTQVIGWKEDLRNLTREDLWNHYRTYYGPHNGMLVIAGDIEPAALQDRIVELFGSTPAGPPPPPMQVVEPPQIAERRVTITRKGTASYFLAAYHVGNARHAEHFPLLMLDAILSGASPMTFMGGSGVATHRSARLYRALVESELASRASSSYSPTIDPGLFYFSATVREGHTLAQVEEVLWKEIERLCAETVTAEELAKAKKQTRAQFAYATESVGNQAFWLGYMEMLGDYHRFWSFADDLDKVTAEDVLRVAQTYLTRANRTVGWFVPADE
jgi:zinc protease